jgi:phosphatidate cytidylyltransferase
LITRSVTAVVFAAAIVWAVFLLPPPATAGVFGALWLGGAWEWSAFARWQTGARAAYVALFAAVMLSAPLWVLDRTAISVILVVALIWWVAALVSIVVFPRAIPLSWVAAAGALVLLPSWSVLTYLDAEEPRGPGLVFSVVAVVWAADVGAYVFGRWLGRLKLAPKLSPGKTWEGVLGGACLAALTGWLASAALGLPGGVFVSIALATALISVVGDLTVSMFKRNVGLKDSGRLLPGHGGVMDRIDSLTAALPIFTLGLKLSGLVG